MTREEAHSNVELYTADCDKGEMHKEVDMLFNVEEVLHSIDKLTVEERGMLLERLLRL